jgi:site-specific recombinase XerD
MSYRDTFALLLRYCRDTIGIAVEKVTLTHLDRELIEGFINFLELERKCSTKTINQRISAIHAFFRYLQVEVPDKLYGCQQIIAIEFKKTSRDSFVEHISLEAIQAILAQPDTETLKGRRDLTILALMYDTGARVSEVADLLVRDVRIDNPVTVKLLGKGSKVRIALIMEQTRDVVMLYIKDQGLDLPNRSMHPLFFNHRKEKLTRAGITYILDKYVNAAREKHPKLITTNVSPHVFRHSKAMHLLQNGVNLVYIRDLLGHSDISTTEIYARADTEMKRKAIENAYDNPTPKSLSAWHRDGDLLNWLNNLGK